jgi:hypothetical protein
MGVQRHYKKRFTKKVVWKSFYKVIDKKSKTDFLDFFGHVFWAFLGEGRSKTRSKGLTKNLTSPFNRGLRGTNQPPQPAIT